MNMTRRMFGLVLAGVMGMFGIGATRSSDSALTCPRCGRRQHVVCRRRECQCYQQIPPGERPQTWTADGEACICPYCGFTAHADYWFELDLRRLDSMLAAEARQELTV